MPDPAGKAGWVKAAPWRSTLFSSDLPEDAARPEEHGVFGRGRELGAVEAILAGLPSGRPAGGAGAGGAGGEWADESPGRR
jgi:hypothetical protein